MSRARALGGAPLLGVLLAGLFGCGGGGTPAAAPVPGEQSTYGGYPSFLPKDTVENGFEHRVVDASAKHPALATQGDTVRVHVGNGAALATVTGPAVPVAGQQFQAPASPVTFHLVIKGVKGSVPLDPSTFQAIDEDGNVYDFVARGHLPARVSAGQTARFTLYNRALETGEGRLRWIPVGHLAPVEWDFVVETD